MHKLRLITRTLTAVFVILLLAPFSLAQDSQCNFLPSGLLRDLSPAIVKLRVTPNGQGTGVIVSSSGVILTAAHVVDNAKSIEVDTILTAAERPQFRYIAEVIHINNDYEFAVLQIVQDHRKRPVENLALTSIPVSQNLVDMGDCISILGYPLAANSTLAPSDGRAGQPTVWQFDRERVQVVATNAEIAEGQSGGAVLDGFGKLRGVVVASRGNQQFSFIMPMNEICLQYSELCISDLSNLWVSAPGSYQSELGCSDDWMPECQLTRLNDFGGSGIYRWTTNDIPEGDYEVKVAIGGTWQENYGADGLLDGTNIPFTVPSTGSLVLFSYNPTFHILTVTVQSERRLITAPGDFQSELGCAEYMGVNGDWAPECIHSRLQDFNGDGVYEWITEDIPAGDWEVKIAINGSWDENYGLDGVGGGLNIPFKVARNGAEVKITYDSRTNRIAVSSK